MFSLRTLPPALLRFALLALLLAAATVVTEQICTHTQSFNRLPYNSMSLGPEDIHADVKMFPRRFDHFGTATFFEPQWSSDFLYPAAIAPIYRVLHLGDGDEIFFDSLCIFVFVLLAGWLFHTLTRRGVSPVAAGLFAYLAIACSYPAYFTYERSNVELIVWLLSFFGVLALLRNRPWLAATLIGLAGACKGYPFFYLGLFLLQKRFRQAAYALGVAAIANVASLWAETHDIRLSYRQTAAGLDEFRQLYVLHRRPLEIGLDHSIFGTIKRFWPGDPAPAQLAHALPIYTALAATLACALFFTRVRKLPIVNQVLFLTIACITLPPTSYDYTLLHLYTPWTLLVLLAVDRWRHNRQPRGLPAIFVCFALLVTPQNEFILHGERLEGAIKLVTLLVLAGLALYYPLGEAESAASIRPRTASINSSLDISPGSTTGRN